MPKLINHAPTPGAIKTRYLHDAINDTKSRLYPGTGVIASITGLTVSQVNDAVRQVRYGALWLDFPYAPPIMRMRDGEIKRAFHLLGYAGQWCNLTGKPTLAAYLNDRTGAERDHPCVLSLSTHYVAVSGGLFCDVASRGVVVDIDEAKGRRKRVDRVLVLTKRVAPTPIFSRVAIGYTKKTGASGKLDQLFRKAIKAETGAIRVKITPNEVFIIRHDESGWYWLGSRDGVEDLILRPQSDGRLRGNTGEAASYRKAMGE